MPSKPTMEGIGISPDGIGHILMDKELAVPVHQRSYAWKKEHVDDLFTDLAGAIEDSNPEYFLGSIVITRNEERRPEVADGQQRLATITILLAAMRDYFLNSNDERRANWIEQKFLTSQDPETLDDIPKLRLNVDDHEYFSRRILKRPGEDGRLDDAKKDPKESHQRIDQAARIAARFVRDLTAPLNPNDRVKKLLAWANYIRDKARVILVEVPDDGTAYIIFETLNDRGLELSKADLVKNYVFSRSKDYIHDVRHRWSVMSGALEAVSAERQTNTYIRHMWISTNGPTRERELYDNIKKKIRGKQAALEFAGALESNATMYASMLNPDHEMWNRYGTEASGRVRTLNQLRMEQVRPLMLAVLNRFEANQAKKSLRLFVNWAVRFLIVGGHGGGVLEGHYGTCAVQVSDGKIKTAQELSKAMEGAVPSDGEFREAFKTARVSQPHLARYYLRALERHNAKDDEPEFVPNADEDTINLEHVLPENPSTGWTGFTQEEAEASYKRIGNMVLLKKSINSRIGNDSFQEKVPFLGQSTYVLTRGVSSYTEWNIAAIDDRQSRLAKMAVKTWPLSIR
jgi:hypothetical protein